MTCVTHHHACDCREDYFRRLEEENRRLRAALKTSSVYFEMLEAATGVEHDVLRGIRAALDGKKQT